MSQNTSTPTSIEKPKSMRPFFIIWGGQAFSLLGSSLVQFALIWYLTTTTGSAMVLATASIMGLLPQLLLGPIAGTLVDRWNRRKVMIVADGVIALSIILLALCFQFGWTPLWLIYSIMFIRSLGGAFHWPAMAASTPLLVPEKHLTRIAGLNQGLQGISNILIPALAALLLEWIPMQGILAIDVTTAIIAIVPLLFIPIPNPTRQDLADQNQENKPSVLDDLRAGLAFVWGWRGLTLVFGLGLVVNIFLTPALMLMPIMLKETFGGDALDLAWAQAGWGVGTILGGLVLGLWSGFNNRMITFLAGAILMGVGLLIIGFAPPTILPLLVAALGLCGFMNTVVIGTLVAILQITVPNEIQGRVFTLFMSVNSGMVPLGLLLAAPIADNVGVQIWFTIGGVVMIVLCTIGFFMPSVLQLEAQGKQAMVDTQSAEHHQEDSTTLTHHEPSLQASA